MRSGLHRSPGAHQGLKCLLFHAISKPLAAICPRDHGFSAPDGLTWGRTCHTRFALISS